MTRAIDTDRFSDALRARLIDKDGNLLISSLSDSEQALDLTEPPNCSGLGRLRHFHRITSPGWPKNPLPIDPAVAALQLPVHDAITAEVFQVAGCNWRCWYCYVPFDRLAADESTSRWTSPAELVRMYASLAQRPPILVLSGGQPDLVPEWVPNTMRALSAHGLDDSTYLWSDDNLSNDFLWSFLSASDLDLMRKYPNYGRVGCFKGFDPHSFAYNTRANSSLYNRQFDLFDRLINLGIDVYGYATFTSDCSSDIECRVEAFVDRLQNISRLLPLRIVPLQIQGFTPVLNRVSSEQMVALSAVQEQAILAWMRIMRERFSSEELQLSVVDVKL